MKIISLGDVHGEDNWLEVADIKILCQTPNLITEYDKYIFVGDYCDSFTQTNTEILHNLKQLLQFKKNYPDNVILLWGNHETHYLQTLDQNNKCSGFRPEAYWDLHILLNENKNSFQYAYQYKNYIWTHAGIHRGWYSCEFPFNSPNVANDLNDAFKQNVACLNDCGIKRGGTKKVGGPLWAHKLETWTKPLQGYHQIVGHTPVDDIKVNFPYKDKETSVTYIDCLSKNKVYTIEI